MVPFTPRQAEIIDQVRKAGATLIAVSKTHPIELIQALYDLGIRDFGENRVQELCSKAPLLPSDIRWHLIGHLQTNKVRAAMPYVHLIHSVDSLKLLLEIEKEAARAGRTVRVLFQFHVANEESKSGIDPEAMDWIFEADYGRDLPHTQPCGVMGMASYTDDRELIAHEFKRIKDLFNHLKKEKFPDNEDFKEISMGMSSDYLIALECGSTMVRIGSLLFGSRS